jgi:hypothetical protein
MPAARWAARPVTMDQDQSYLAIGVVAFALVPAVIAYNRGHNPVPYFLLSFVFTPIVTGVLASIGHRNVKVLTAREDGQHARRGEIRCPACREFMRSDATICPHCSTPSSPSSAAQSEAAKPPST